ncbi:GNAT family N-acetyltransferase [Streptomyces sp. NPDC002463]|uniref:GNAT family N-acetyltransferase n=1 Tax=Streptomyces sp. NPDC002463 TaxID=3364645 RepID=UPI00368E9898
MSDKITLRPVTAGDLDVWEREFDGPEGRGVHQWFGHQSTADLRHRFAENGLLGPDGGLFSVVEGDVTVGRVKWFPGTWGPADLTDWSPAVGLVPSVRGRGIGTRAQRLLADYLFEHTRADRGGRWNDSAVHSMLRVERPGNVEI